MCLTLIPSFCGSKLSQMNTGVPETNINFISYTLDLVLFHNVNTRSIDFLKVWLDCNVAPVFYFPKLREFLQSLQKPGATINDS